MVSRAWQDKVFGGFTNSASFNGDKRVTLIALQTLASQHGGVWVSLGMLPSNSKAATRSDVNNLGGSVGLLVQSPSDASVAEIPRATWTPPSSTASGWPTSRRASRADAPRFDLP